MSERMNAYKVPEGYFDSLKNRLEAIPAQEAVTTPVVTLWQKVQPYMALAACFAVALVAGSLLLNRHSGSLDADFQEYYYSHLNSVENPYALYDGSLLEGVDESVPSDDDIIEYLIASGATADYFAYVMNQ